MTSGLELSAGIASEDDGKIIMSVTVGIGDSTSPHNHGVVKEGVSIDVFGRFHAFQEVGELLSVKGVDLGDLIHLVLRPPVVGKAMVAFVEAERREASVAAVVRKQEGGNTGLVGLEGQEQHVK